MWKLTLGQSETLGKHGFMVSAQDGGIPQVRGPKKGLGFRGS